jgi:CubicO group peptidase (beta-lactamase class C family)
LQPALVAGAERDPARLEAVESFIESSLKEWKVPGLAIAVIDDGEVILKKGFGYRNVEEKLPVTERTLFAIGSNTKSFTAAVLGMLADEKKLEWDRPVREYLPDFRLFDDAATDGMTPRDLVTHRSGLPRHDLLWYASGLSRRELYERLRHLEPSKPLRSLWQYQNLMFMTAGYLEERIASESWEEIVRERLLNPLGMSRSNFSVADMERSDEFSYPYGERKDEVARIPFRNIDEIGPAGSINSSVEEMIRYVQFHLDRGKVGDKQLLSPESSRAMQTAQVAMPPSPLAPDYPEQGPTSYGLGLIVTNYRGHKMVLHGGGIDGFISQMAWLPDEGIGAVVLTNYSGFNPVPTLVVQHTFDRLLGLEPVDWTGRARELRTKADKLQAEARSKDESARKSGTTPSHPLADYQGAFEHPGYGTLWVKKPGEGLEGSVSGITFPLEHYHYDVFRVPYDLEAPLDQIGGRKAQFFYDTAGAIDRVALPLEEAVPDIVFTRVEKEGN